MENTIFDDLLDFVDIRELSLQGKADDYGYDEYDALEELDDLFADFDSAEEFPDDALSVCL
jgi:hypothetical protein